MKEACSAIQSAILDAFDDAFSLSEEIMQHLAQCEECNAFYRQLAAFNAHLTIPSEPIEIDRAVINRAIDEGLRKRQVRENVWSNFGFLILILTLFCVAGILIQGGHSKMLLIFQIFLVTLTPVIIPLVLYKQMKGGA